MAWREIGAADLEGDALRRWYSRSPDDVERRRRAVADARYQAFFPRKHLAAPPLAFRPAAEPSHGAQGASINSDIGFREDDLERPPTWRAGVPNRWRLDEVLGADRGASPVPLPSPALGQEDEWSRPIPLSSISLPAGEPRRVPPSPIFASEAPSSVGSSTAAQSLRSISYRPEQPASDRKSVV